jgi:hypothetical protein
MPVELTACFSSEACPFASGACIFNRKWLNDKYWCFNYIDTEKNPYFPQ